MCSHTKDGEASEVMFDLVAQDSASFKPEVHTLLVIGLSLDVRQAFRCDTGKLLELSYTERKKDVLGSLSMEGYYLRRV